MKSYYFGIDIGGTELKIGMFDETHSLIDSFKVPTPKENVRDELIDEIYNVVNAKLKEHGSDVSSLKGIGMTVPSPVLDGIVIFASNVDFGHNFDIVNAVKRRFNNYELTTIVGNDANLAAYGEYRRLGSNIKNLVFITLGTGIGGGIIYEGHIINGATGSGGEIGHIPYFNQKNRLCGCGRYDCIETVAGTPGMIKTANELLKEEKSSLEGLKLTPKIIFDHAKEGDLVALKVVDSVALAIATMAATISVIVDPELFLVGGGVSKAGQFLLTKINYHYQKLARFKTTKAKFELARLGNDAGFYGAFYYLLDSI